MISSGTEQPVQSVSPPIETVRGVKALLRLDTREIRVNGKASHDDEINVSAVRQQLCKILDSRTFRMSKRLCAFLEFSVTETLEGRFESITAPTVAIEVFNKGRELDLKSEGLVRVQARQLRLKLSSYYEEEGHEDPIRISIPQGGYAASFDRKHSGGLVPLHAEKDDSDELVPPKGVAIFVTAVDCHSDETIAKEIAGTISHDIAAAMAPFPDFEICDVSFSQSLTKKIRAPSLTLHGNLTWEGSEGHFTVALQDSGSQEIIWSSQYVVEGWQERLSVARRVAVAVASPSGAVAARQAHALKNDGNNADDETAIIFEINNYASRPNIGQNIKLRKTIDRLLSQPATIKPRLWAASSLLLMDAARYRYDQKTPQDTLLDDSLDAARTAVSLGPDCSYCWCMLSGIYYERREFERSDAAAKTALELNPNNTDAMMLFGMHLWNCDRIEDGLKLIEEAFYLNTRPPTWYYLARAHELIRNGQFNDALRAVAHVEMGDFFWPSLLEAAIFGHIKDAKNFLRSFKKVNSVAPWILANLSDVLEDTPFPNTFRGNLIDGIDLGIQFTDANKKS